jgi:hypothetical protein
MMVGGGGIFKAMIIGRGGHHDGALFLEEVGDGL